MHSAKESVARSEFPGCPCLEWFEGRVLRNSNRGRAEGIEGRYPKERHTEVLSGPFCGGVGRDPPVQDAATIMGKHEENK